MCLLALMVLCSVWICRLTVRRFRLLRVRQLMTGLLLSLRIVGPVLIG
jgi:hypothetical protein